ncbi:hypothetical protein TNCV_463031 [Trichonephila clavipes]|nr:hypothetical protein TNCV_463031 [Trichonephila clavipes]
MALRGSLPQINLGGRSVTQGGHHTVWFHQTTFYLLPAARLTEKIPRVSREAGPLVLSSWIPKRLLTLSGSAD